jgi:flagellar protein FliO/FliZ
MQWLSDLPFSDNRMVQIGFLVACALAALVVLAILYRFVFAHRLRVPGGRTRQPRLGLVDAFSLDGQRQLVLVRRDNVEHLIMIGGPNDVLVESQINRALAAARENNLAPAAQPKAAPRPAEPAPPVAATQVPAPQAPAPAAANALPPQPHPAASAARAVRGEVRPIRPQNVSLGPASPASEAPRPAAPVAPEPAPPAGASKAQEPAAQPVQSQPQPRPLPPRPAMPPPINPMTATARATVSPLPGRHIHATPPVPSPTGAPPAPIPDAASGPHPGPEAPASAPPTEPARAVFAGVPLAAGAKAAATPVVPAAAAMIVKAEPKINPPNPHGAEAPPSTDRQATAARADPSLIEKPPAKAEDPFGGLESLEAEMARLLGREKQG